MARRHAAVNPFYVLVVVFGIAFALTASAYTVMTFKAMLPAAPDRDGDVKVDFLDRHGGQVMAFELGLLAVATVAAMATDRFSMRRACDEYQARQTRESPDQS